MSRRRMVASAAAGALAAPAALAVTGIAPTSDGPQPSAGHGAIAAAVHAAIEQGGIPGAVVAVMKSGSTVLAQGYGTANLETGTPLSPDSVLRIGSLTKQFTAAAAIRLAAQGKLDLAAPVSKHLPAFAPLAPFTPLELMHQTAGLHSDESEDGAVCAAKPLGQVDLATQIARQAKPFDFPPGTAWLYSNANYIVLGALIEQVMDMPLAAAMARLVFEPLGLKHTAFDNAEEVVAGRASGYTATDTGTPPFVNAAWIDPSQAGGAGALRSTVGDLCQWHRLLLADRLLDNAHTRLMLTPGRLRDGRPSSAHRFSPDDASYGDTEYACGLLVTGPSQPQPSILHYGVINGFCALLQTWTGPGVTLAALCNAFIGPKVPFSGIRKAVVEGWVAG